MAEALPSRYEVAKRGTPDPPEAQYVVLDVVHDYEARYLVRMYINALRTKGKRDRADELEAGLDTSRDAHQKAMSANNPPPKTKKTPERPMPKDAITPDPTEEST